MGSLLACDGGFGSLGSHFVAYGGHSGTIYDYLGVSVRGFGHFGMALGSVWGGFAVMLWSLWASGGAVGSHGHFWHTLGPLWVYSGCVWGPLCAYERGLGTLWGRFGITLSSPWVHF